MDDVQTRMEAAANNASAGREQLGQAKRMKSKVRRRKVYLSLVLGGVVITVILLLVLLA